MGVIKLVASFMYWSHKVGMFKSQINIMSIDDTIEMLKCSDKSLVRYGDGEIVLIAGRQSATQMSDKDLSERLIEVLESQEPNLEIAIPDIFRTMKKYHAKSQEFWKRHLLFHRHIYKKYCGNRRIFYNAFVTRPYYIMKDRAHSESQFQMMRQVWKDKKIVVVEGAGTHNGVGNNLLSEAASIERIICPSRDAYLKYEEILSTCCLFENEKTFLLSLGATAKPLTLDLYKRGYRVIDIGNLDLEYEWFLAKEERKVDLKKHSIIGKDANLQAGYSEYWEQIKYFIGDELS